MLKKNRNKNCFNKSSELEIFLSTGMEVFNNQNINIKKQDKEKNKKNIDTDKKIDELIESYEKLIINKKNDKKIQEDTKPYLEFVEIRESIEKKPKTTEFDKHEKINHNEEIKNMRDKTKEITFNIKEDKSNLKELTFNVTNNEDKIKTENVKDNKKINKKRFFSFKSKKNRENNQPEKTIENLKKQKNKKKFFSKNKENIKEKNKKTKEQKNNQNKDNSKITDKENNFLDEDIRKVLLITDNLLEKLPEDVINEFIKSDDFELYEKVINKIK